MRVVLLAHGGFPERAKTAVGVLRYSDHDVVAVLDEDEAGKRVSELVADASDVSDAPVVGSVDDVTDADALVIGVAPIGGGFDESWRPDVRRALERGWDVVSGLHYFLSDDDEFARLADENAARIRDLRRPPSDLGVSTGTAAESTDATVVLTVGTDCSVGKMTTTLELVEEARRRGDDAAFVPTGQTGVIVEGDGIVVDAVASDFVAGAVEEMVLERADSDYVFVEGQGSIVHPAYSGVTCGILHGAMPDYLVLCHEAGRESVHGYGQRLPPLDDYVDIYERLARPVHEAEISAGALDTSALDEDEAADAVESFSDEIDAPSTDPVRFGAAEILDSVR